MQIEIITKEIIIAAATFRIDSVLKVSIHFDNVKMSY